MRAELTSKEWFQKHVYSSSAFIENLKRSLQDDLHTKLRQINIKYGETVIEKSEKAEARSEPE